MEGIFCEIVGFAGFFEPRSWAYCDGRVLTQAENPTAFMILKGLFGGDGSTTAALPNLSPFVGSTGHQVRRIIALNGDYIPQGVSSTSEVKQFVGVERATRNGYWRLCDGETLPIEGHQALFSLTGNRFGGNIAENTFALPDLAEQASQGSASTVPYFIVDKGIYPSRGDEGPQDLTAFMAQVALFASDFSPAGWLPCDGRLLNIASNTRLFSLIGGQFGGDSRQNFALPLLDELPTSNGDSLKPHLCVKGFYPVRG